MEHCYTIKNGELILCNSMRNKLSFYFSYLFQLVKIAFWVSTMFVTIYITNIIYKKCITNITLSECIPLGSIFATFGSAVISVLSIYCGEQRNLFQENLVILREQVSELDSWQRWPFLKRISKKKMTFLHNNYYMLSNPQITFKTKTRKLTVPIPSCAADFKDLPLIISMLKMIHFHREYFNFIYCFQNTGQHKALLIFDCILMIYKNIIRYKIGTFFMWIGAEYVLSSIIFSFSYKQVNQILAFLETYF